MSLEGGDDCISPFNTSCRLTCGSWKSTLTTAALFCLSLLTVVLNLVVVLSILYFRHFQTTTNVILLSMAASDLLMGLVVMPFEVIILDPCQCITAYLCIVFYLFSFILIAASVGNILLITVDRYVAICYPLRYSSIKPKRVKTGVSLCWTCSIAYSFILLKDNLSQIDFSISCANKCTLSLNYILAIVDIIITFFLPLTVILVLYARVFVVAVTQARAMRSQVSAISSQSVSAMKSEMRAARKLGIIVLFFLMCFLPYYITSLTSQDISTEASTGQVLLLFSNSTINPIIYAFFYPWFRKKLKVLISCKTFGL